MATSITPAEMKTRCPAWVSESDSELQDAIDEAVRWLNEANWGTTQFDDGVFYLAAHIFTQFLAHKNAAATGQGGAVPPGAASSKRQLSWAVSYAVPPGGFSDADLASTSYGRTFLSRRSLIFSSRVLP